MSKWWRTPSFVLLPALVAALSTVLSRAHAFAPSIPTPFPERVSYQHREPVVELPLNHLPKIESFPLSSSIRQALASENATGFISIPERTRPVLLVNGSTDDSFIVTLAVEDGKQPSDYKISFSSNNSQILNDATDIAMSQVESTFYLNATVAVDFHNYPGWVSLTAEARRVVDDSVYDSFQIDYLVAGAVVYVRETGTIISGSDKYLSIQSYEDIFQKPHWEFGLFAQFLNGTNSDTIVATETQEDVPMAAMEMSAISADLFDYAGQILWDSDACVVDGGIWEDGKVILNPGCGMGIAGAYTNDSVYDGLRLAFNFQKNRAGNLGVQFTWNGFTYGSEFTDEEFSTVVNINIEGQPPAVVRRIEPANPFSKDGGEELYVETINTADVNMSSFNVNEVPFLSIPGTRMVVNGPDDFYETVKFLTKAGTGKKLPWTISATRSVNGTDVHVEVQDETGFLFSYNDEAIIIESVSPQHVPETGQVYVVLSGSFPQFDPAKEDHNVLIGNIAIDKSRIASSSESEITFIIPPHFDYGAAWEFDVVVQIGESFSNEYAVEYQPSELQLRGLVFGASYDEDSRLYVLNSCGNTTFIVSIVDHETSNATFEWTLLDDTNFDLFSLANASSVVKNKETMELPNGLIPRYNEPFFVNVLVSLGDLQSTYTYTVEKSTGYLIGVTLIQPENRTISTPPVNLRVIAKIEVPECVDMSGELVYEWEYENKSETLTTAARLGRNSLSVHDSTLPPHYLKYVFSFENDTGTFEGAITPTRLGRELIVPRELIQYGLHRVRLTVQGNTTDHAGAFLSGSDSTSFTIHESPLIASIGAGQLSRKVSDAENLNMSAFYSFDPDVLTSPENRVGLKYEWSCIFSLHSNFSGSEDCDTDLLPPESSGSESFLVASSGLQVASQRSIEGDGGNVYLKYGLIVKKWQRSNFAEQEVIIMRSNGKTLARYDRIEIVNSRDEFVNPDAVEFWEDVIIRPISKWETTEWRFQLVLPLSERSRFLTSGDNLIPRAGYYRVTGNSAPGFQQLPLGILADRLFPRQIYEFAITFREAGRISDEVVVRLKTVEVPNIVMHPLVSSQGTTDTVFRATATTSFNGNALFVYQFYLLEEGRTTREYCVDGCTGAHTVRFQVSKPGRYMLQCRLLAATGRTLLSVKNNTQLLMVSSSGSANFAEFDFDILKDYKSGDDGSVIQKGFFVSESIHERDGQVVAMSDSSADLCATYTKKWAQISRQIVRNEFPNTPNARNYVILAANYARLSCVEYEDTLYELLAIVERSIAKTPQEEMLTMSSYSRLDNIPKVELEEELRRFYNFTVTRTASIMARGTARSRLMPQEGVVNNLILDVMEMWMRHVTTASTSGRVCGWDETYSLGTSDGMPDGEIVGDSTASPLGQSVVRVAVKCNREQGTQLETTHASFEWCDAVYTVSGSERKLVMLGETFDYPYLSGVQGTNASETKRVVMVDITTLGEANQLVSAMSAESVVAAQAADDGDNGGGARTCYKIGMEFAPKVTARASTCWANVPFLMWPRKTYGRQYGAPFQGGAYQRRTSGITTTVDTRNNSDVVVARANDLGLYGAVRSPCGGDLHGDLGALDGAGMIVAGLLIGILLLILVITGLSYLLVSAIVGVGAQNDEADEDAEAAAAAEERYVERDYFGRKEVRLNMTSMDSSASAFSTSQRSLLPAEGGGGGGGGDVMTEMSLLEDAVNDQRRGAGPAMQR